MSQQHHPGRSSLIEVLDRVLDKGIVIDAWARLVVGGIELVNVDARVVVASFETYLKYADSLRATPAAAPVEPRPTTESPALSGSSRAAPRQETLSEALDSILAQHDREAWTHEDVENP